MVYVSSFMPSVFLYRFGPLFLVLHALCAIVLCGAAVHQGIIALYALRGRPRLRLARVYGVVSVLAYLATLLFGGLLYPRYRYFVRGLYLDRHAPWMSNLFDLKENLATLGLPLAVGALVLSVDLPRHKDDKEALSLYGALAVSNALLVLFNLVAGLLCTGAHGA